MGGVHPGCECVNAVDKGVTGGLGVKAVDKGLSVARGIVVDWKAQVEAVRPTWGVLHKEFGFD
jgi:hypothetical protein